MLVALRNLDKDETDGGLVYMDATLLPTTAVRTFFFDENGSRLFLIGSAMKIVAEDNKLGYVPEVVYNKVKFRFRFFGGPKGNTDLT